MINIPDHLNMMPLCVDRREEPAYCNAIEEINDIEGDNPWYDHILQYITHGTYPENTSSKDQRALRTLAAQYGLINGQLCKKGPNGQSLLCIDQLKATRLMENTHKGVCGPHMNGKMLSKIIS